MKYLKKFEKQTEYDKFKNSPLYIEPNVSLISENNGKMMYNKKSDNKILSFSLNKPGDKDSASIALKFSSKTPDAIIEYSYDGMKWTTYKTFGDYLSINIKDPKVFFRGNNPTQFSSDADDYYYFDMKSDSNSQIFAEGDVTSLLNGVGGDYSLKPVKPNVFCNLFAGCSIMATAPNLPSTTLIAGCYYGMFRECTSLKESPILPAETLNKSCYEIMFYGCTSLAKITALFVIDPKSINTYANDWAEKLPKDGNLCKNKSLTLNDASEILLPNKWKIEDYSPKNETHKEL